ncbi:hypothetical protein THRCLA_04305 [Thraustotheca clavata]|uniref:START domain-containing protein n=1 Tax=Thraustotheca clavata TaxID=74557 RepID=A0A1V9ZZF3_9STRA|nr:hypothetical protein THRCLA_04305 [Thraustotheca clavata]
MPYRDGMNEAEHDAILTKASKGMDDLINWAKQTPKSKLLPKTTNWTFEACRHELNLDGAGTFDDLIALYQSSNDMAATMNYVHVDKSQVLFPLDAPGINISLRLGIFRAPLPFMRDRSATYIEYTKEFIDSLGRRGFARYIRSHSLGAVHTSYVRANIRSWGVVIVETNDPQVLHVSSTVDIDWNGNMPTWVATLMTSRRAQSIKNLAAVLRASKKLRLKRCGGCGLKPGFFTRDIQLVPCSNCANLMCTTCRSVTSTSAVRCWSCVRAISKVNTSHPIVILEQDAGNNTPHSCQHYESTRLSEKMSWLSPQNHHHHHVPAAEVTMDLSYLRSATKA